MFFFLFLSSISLPNPASLIAQDKGELLSESNKDEEISRFRNLSFGEKITYFKALNKTDQKRIFEGLSEDEKQEIIAELNEEDRRILWETVEEKKEIPPITKYPQQEPPSEIESILSGRFPTDITKELRQYGYDFFSKEAPSFKPLTNVPVGPDYIIGPGDNFTIHLWGNTEQTYNTTVAADGRITLPRLGTLNVSSLTFVELKNYLSHKFREYYPDFKISITMGTLRMVEIFLVGEANNPGTYSVSSLSTVISALYATGGPTKKGSLRNIKLFRNKKLMKTLDLYDFFIKGMKNDDVRLQPGDTIFIPIIEPVVGIAGYVKRPAIYEMKGGETIKDVIDLAGGVLPLGYLQNVVIERLKGHQRRVVKSFNLDPSNKETDVNLKMPLMDGDLIKIYPIHKAIRQIVYLKGHVKYPREHELKPGMRLLDLIPSYDVLLSEPYLPVGEIIRLMPPDLHPEIIEFNLEALLSGDRDQNLLLQDQDSVIVYSRWEKKERPKVTINGAVRNPGTYSLLKGMTIKDLIFQAGNLTNKAYTDRADLSRLITLEKGTETLKLDFSPKKALADEKEDNLVLQKDDVIHIREIPMYKQALQRKIILEGEFVFPGEYIFSDGERLSSVIQRAGGLNEDAYPFGAMFFRESAREIQRLRFQEYIAQLQEDIRSLEVLSGGSTFNKEDTILLQTTLSERQKLLERLERAQPTGRMVIQLEEVLLIPSSKFDFQLRPGDHLIVEKRPDFVNVLGEVYNPTALLAEKERSVDYYLERVGGVTKDADKKQIYIVKADGTVISKQQGGFFGLGFWNQENKRWTSGSFGSVELDPGDTIIVPRKLVKTDWMQIIKDTSQILYQIAIAAGVVKETFGLF